jgi:hypothetical protein
MVNFTVSLPEELKAEMDKFPDVNWSELTRKSIQNYLRNRASIEPPLEFTLEKVDFILTDNLVWTFGVGNIRKISTQHSYIGEYFVKPTMLVSLGILNKLDSQLIIDRILFYVRFAEAKFQENFLNYIKISPGDSGSNSVYIPLSPPVDMLKRSSDKIQGIDILLIAYVQGFAAPVIKGLSISVPINDWKNQVKSVLAKYNADWNQGQPTQK